MRSTAAVALSNTVSTLLKGVPMTKLILTALAVALMAHPALAAKQKRNKHQWVQQEKTEKDSILQDYVKENGEICYRQVMMVTGGARPTVAMARGAAVKAWRAEVKKIHGIRFTDTERAIHPDGKGKGVDIIQLPPEFGLDSFVVKGRPCAVSF